MSKFNSKDFEKSQIEKLKQEQLIKSILNRSNLEKEATIQAVKEGPYKSLREIQERKAEILKRKLHQQNIENEKQIEEKKRLIRIVNTEVHNSNRQERQLKQQRRQNVDEILKELNIGNNNKVLRQYQEIKRRNLEKSENEKLRQRNIIQEKKRKNVLAQLELEKSKEKQQVEGKLKQIEQLDKKKVIQQLNEIIIEHSNKDIKNESNTSKVENKFDIVKRKISNFKLIKAINAYRNNMKYYHGENNVGSNFDETVGEIKPKESKKETRKNFAQALHSVVNHKKAQEEVKKQVAPRFEPRTH